MRGIGSDPEKAGNEELKVKTRFVPTLRVTRGNFDVVDQSDESTLQQQVLMDKFEMKLSKPN